MKWYAEYAAPSDFTLMNEIDFKESMNEAIETHDEKTQQQLTQLYEFDSFTEAKTYLKQACQCDINDCKMSLKQINNMTASGKPRKKKAKKMPRMSDDQRAEMVRKSNEHLNKWLAKKPMEQRIAEFKEQMKKDND
jgi:thioredoxin-like negative regulator of GroEL